MTPAGKTRDFVSAIIIALFAALILRQFVIAAYKIPTGSMEKTLLVGDFLLVNKFVYGAKTPDWVGIPFTENSHWAIPTGHKIPTFRLPPITLPRQNDIFVFKYPRDPSIEYIKRCVATGGHTVEIKDKMVFVDGVRFPDPPHLAYIDPNIFVREYREYDIFRPELGNRDNFGPLFIPPGNYFAMGDNRDNSLDSRYWGFVPADNIVGKPLLIYLSIDQEEPLYDIFKKIRWNRLGEVIR